MTKRIISLIVCLSLLLSMIVLPSAAEETAPVAVPRQDMEIVAEWLHGTDVRNLGAEAIVDRCAKNGITDIELFGPYLREDILALDPSISEVIESDGAWYFYRITTQNDNIAKIYSYPTYQVAMMDAAYASLFMLIMQRSWMVENSYFCHPFNSNLCVFAMVEDGDGVMSDIVMSNILNYNDQARDAQEFVDHYYAEHSAE
jgi:hypothetical protein